MALAVIDVPDRPARDDLATLQSISVLCQSSLTSPTAPKPVHHHPASRDIGVLAWALGQPAALAATAWALPAPSSVVSRRLLLAQPRAPPALAHLNAFARGPPRLV